MSSGHPHKHTTATVWPSHLADGRSPLLLVESRMDSVHLYA